MSNATAAALKLRSLYRALLRELPPRPLQDRTNSPLHAHVRSSLAAAPAPASTTPSTTATATTHAPAGDRSVAEAEQLAAYLRAQRMYATLLERYNPGMGMDEEERVRLTARRVGMNLPIEFDKSKGTQ